MRYHVRKIQRRVRVVAGQSLVEYAIILMLIAMVAFLMLSAIGTKTSTAMQPAADALNP